MYVAVGWEESQSIECHRTRVASDVGKTRNGFDSRDDVPERDGRGLVIR